MELSVDKTKLLVFTPPRSTLSSYWFETQPLMIQDTPITPSVEAVHLGVVRQSSGSNIRAIQSRISAHSKALQPVLACGAARSHSASPAALLRAEIIYGSSVIFSGLSSLILSKTELDLISKYHTDPLEMSAASSFLCYSWDLFPQQFPSCKSHS